MAPILLIASSLLGSVLFPTVSGQCIADSSINDFFIPDGETQIPVDGSCCQADVCGLGCPEEVPAPAAGFGIAVMVTIAIFVVAGFATIFFIKDKSENFFVAGRSLPLWVVTLTLGSQSLDSNALLGNADLSYKYHFWDGACLPIGLGLSLILNGVFLAAKINKDGALTLPDVFGKRYGKLVEVMASLCTITSFLCLLAGNLVGMGTILSYILGMSQTAAIWMSAALVLLYTIAGGLFSVAYTDVLQAAVGWIGSLTVAFYLRENFDVLAPPPSRGFPNYTYPDDETCEMYNGIPCYHDASLCCYNADYWCPSDDNCTLDNGAYPFGDAEIFNQEMTDPRGLTPFPNAIVFNWATIFVLGFGNLAALDFQARCMASKTPQVATMGSLFAGVLTFMVGIPFSYLGSLTRTFYGPDTARAMFETDTCSRALALPTCALWLPDPNAFIKMLTHEAPAFLGGWCLIAIIAASMSTCDGAILAMGTVFSHNIIRNLSSFFPFIKSDFITSKNLLNVARIASIPFTVVSALIASFYQSSHSLGATGYLLVVAFDIVLASTVVPLFGCFYTKKPSTLAAILAILTGTIVRVVLEFALPKDGFLIAPFSGDEFLDYGSAANTLYPPFFDVPEADKWLDVEECEQTRLKDFSGVDSLAAPIVALIVFVVVQFLERNGPIFEFSKDGVMAGYLKEGQVSDDMEEAQKVEEKFEDDM